MDFATLKGYAGFTFKSFHVALVFWVPEQPSSLREAPKRTERDRDSCPVYTFANPVRFVAFN